MATRLADGKGTIDSYGNAEFSREVIDRFPILRNDLEFDVDLLHPQMGTLAALIRQSMELGDTHLPMQILAFLDEVLRKPNAIAEIENAVAISFIEARELRRTSTGEAILRMMPASVRRVLLEQENRIGGE